ncbi:hypothetical protein BN7_4949 [Wickerhamomyces ciferrii]|uniref:Zn(2)-C6 fungal-type domain-containing protein n=1 Tax=Wickerhamomyces ciferrii (strain ATCC 14091 / BCRC 22168 / CBS 111 / JCM 3599 / NBRC 0793 / NRRL Y-1031 F-60-10) TaxID=1206466 RepID=K0KTM0_WICCF|nr:uncharacterized protein BN7_4949 [Wickerhamomyces ciferrii]CCH45367.1 hypothetical protein BN7_4949 [Wickerhamomyces ciferrii]
MPKSKRTRTGCLCCRRRHKKCDEMKPSCKFCLSKGLVCEWPVKGSVFVNYQSQSQQSNIINNQSLLNLSSNNLSDSESISISSNSRKSSIDFNYSTFNSFTTPPSSTSSTSSSSSTTTNPNSISLPPIKHYHMVIPRNTNMTSPKSTNVNLSSNKITKPKISKSPTFKTFTFNNISTFDENLTPINTAKRLSVDSLLN